MGDKKDSGKKGKRGVAVGLGLTAASMLAVQGADAASEVAQLAAGDSRFGIIAGLFLPALGWVVRSLSPPTRGFHGSSLPTRVCFL